jgi:CheY-like chemotaxis protein
VLGIVKGHDGLLDVRSEVGKGTTFTVFLPATPEADVPSAGAPASKDYGKGNGELILIVDDEPEILKITQQNLERNGYRTVGAEDGVSALALFAQRREEIHAILTDLEMPLMDGVTLIRAIRKSQPEARIMASSGIGTADGLRDRTAQLKELGVVTFLIKPYGADALLQALQEALGRTRSF